MTVCSMTQSNVKVTSPLKLEIRPFSKAISYGTISKFDRAGFSIFGLVFVSRNFEVGTNVRCEESTVSPRTGLIFCFYFCNFCSFLVPCAGLSRPSRRLLSARKYIVSYRIIFVYCCMCVSDGLVMLKKIITQFCFLLHVSIRWMDWNNELMSIS